MAFIARLLNLLNLDDAQRFPGGCNAAWEPLLWQLCSGVDIWDVESETTGLLWLTVFPLAAVLRKDKGLLTGVFHKMC